jgi:hypothetical protein
MAVPTEAEWRNEMAADFSSNDLLTSELLILWLTLDAFVGLHVSNSEQFGNLHDAKLWVLAAVNCPHRGERCLVSKQVFW